MGIRIVSLNIQHGGGKRIARLADWLLTKKPSVVVLPEWRNNVSGQQIRERLADNGYRTGAAARAAPKVNSIFFAAKDLTSFQCRERALVSLQVKGEDAIGPDTCKRH